MDVDPEACPPRRIEELWFEDGNIVIQAGNSQFRVYRGVLAARSSVFQDMLSFPQPQDSELVEGCPLVRLTDSEIEVGVFLKALFEPEFFMPFPSPTTFDVLSGCLRLSHKYGVDYLRRRALVHLSTGYDTELSKWDSDKTTPYFCESPLVVSPNITSWYSPKDPAGDVYAIQLFREVDALWLLPNAFYVLSLNFENFGRSIFHGVVYNGVQASLSIEDQVHFAYGHAIQSRSAAKILRFLADPDIDGCASPTECAIGRFTAIGNISQPLLQDYLSDPLDVWVKAGDPEALEDATCTTCFNVLEEAHQGARQAFWDKLPGIYCLPPWEELEKMKMAAIGAGWIS
ncbi:hypothetical protein B0H11DRAFT_1752724 [Mycena galericulata]|nr:hypothetical protein B0H11DRAFT_1752724 [Mycena galericulata]